MFHSKLASNRFKGQWTWGLRLIAAAGFFASFAATAQAADAAAGKAKFEDACSLCHSAAPGDGLGGMGPELHSLDGKAAGTADKAFPYTAALKNSKLVWSAATLDQYLAAPQKVVPGTEMIVALPAKPARDDVVAYLLSVKKAAAAK